MLKPTESANQANDHPECIGDVPFLTERERHRILYEWNDTREEYPDACVHELFEQQVARNPDAVAVVFKERQLSYRELNERANQVAHYLQKHGVGPESLVGICLERSPEMVIALFGVWKAGGAYIPLDPTYPQERLSLMVIDAGAKVLLTDENCRSLFPFAYDRAISLDADWPVIAQESTSNLAAGTIPSNLAYVMYTSGTTGQPKGAMIYHGALVNYLSWANRVYPVGPGGSVPVHTSIAFDSTVASLYPPLLAGGQIELLPEDMGAKSLLAGLYRGKNRSKVVITPAHLELLSRELSPVEMASMTKILVIAGETLLAERLSQWRDFAPETRLFNEYGPTETTVGCCAYEVRAGDPHKGPVPIGRPIANTQLYILDPDLQPVSPGVIGELYIGGAGVGRGYLHRPELTRKRFLADPFSGQSGARLYKTGDLARYRNDGTLEFVGRVDDQVKVRGYRIEVGEVEAALAGHAAVQSCTVSVRENTAGNKQLVAYVIARESETLEAEELRNFLKRKLPKYMVPVRFVFLDSFPLNQNGKIDRTALHARSHKNILINRKYVAPRTETEKKLAAIWTELLEVDRIGIHDDLLDLGADSLLAVKGILHIRDVFETMLSMQDLCPSATIAGLAKALTVREEYRGRLAYAVPFRPEGNELPFFWMGVGPSAHQLTAHLGSNQPFFGIGIEPQIVDQLKASYRMDELAKHLVLAIREKQPHGPYRLGGFCQDAIIAYEAARQLTMQGQTVGLLALVEPEYPRRSARARIGVALRRKIIQSSVHLDRLNRLGTGRFPFYGHNQRRYLKRLLTRISGRILRRFQFSIGQAGPPSLKRITFLAATSYKPEPLGCSTVIFRCKDSPYMSAGDPYFGWRELFTGRSETYEVPGDHLGIFHEPNVQVLAKQLRVCLHGARH